jgi:hypothetical protein
MDPPKKLKEISIRRVEGSGDIILAIYSYLAFPVDIETSVPTQCMTVLTKVQPVVQPVLDTNHWP